MSVIGITMVYNEEDIIEYTIRHSLEQFDKIILADNRSTDRTREILESFHDPNLIIEDEPSFAYNQHLTMNRLSEEAREMGAEWVVPFDADEWWYSPAWPIRDTLPSLMVQEVKAEGRNFTPHPTDDPNEPNPFKRCVMRRDVVPNWKVAYRPQKGRVLSFGNHFVSDGYGWGAAAKDVLFIRHLPYRTIEQAKAKVRHGKEVLEASGQNEAIGWHWRQYGSWDDDQFVQFWEGWTHGIEMVKEPMEDGV